MRIIPCAIVSIVCLCFVGCTKDEPSPVESPATKAPISGKMPNDAIHAGLGKGDGTPSAGQSSGTGDYKPPRAEGPPPTPAQRKTLASAQAKTKAVFEKSPADARAKAAYVEATIKLANATMYAPDLSPHDKYSGALKLFREALKADSGQQEAKYWIATIEGIYKSMKLPIPE